MLQLADTLKLWQANLEIIKILEVKEVRTMEITG